jgi:hypothetical protein
MQRRTAVAAASAISMSLLSGVVFVGAHLGALGFGSPPVARTAITPAAVTVPAPAANQNQPTTTPNVSSTRVDTREHDDAEHSGSQGPATSDLRSNARSGGHDD